MQTRFKEKVFLWQALVDNLGPQLVDLPHLAADHAALTAVVDRARSLQAIQETALAQLRDVNEQRVELLQEGIELNTQLSHGLKHALGNRSQKLLKFGVKPRAKVIRRKRVSSQEQAAREASKAATTAAAQAPASEPPPHPATT